MSALSGASTSRVLNLAAIARANSANEQHRARPMFASAIINSAILLKHRVRSDESYLFAGPRAIATKIIVPFDLRDLKSGGRSFFVDQRGFRDMLREAGNYNSSSAERDIEVLRVLNAIPSLDPFLLREQLRAHGIECADSYFEISPADQQRMTEYVAREIRRLIELATGGERGGRDSTERLAAALLSSAVDEKLEPLRLTLALNPADFREGVFSWRGFLYYKWCMEKFWPEIISVLREIRAVKAVGALDAERLAFLATAQRSIIEKVRDSGLAVRRTLTVYDEAYEDLVRHNAPRTFRDFLMSAPYLFVELGEKMGAITHISSFWRYRFPGGVGAMVDAEELVTIFQDFAASFGEDKSLAAA